jgi:hypothetical protein
VFAESNAMNRPKILKLSTKRYFIANGASGILTDDLGPRSFSPNDILAIKGEVFYFVKSDPLPKKEGYPKNRVQYADEEEAKFPIDDEKHVRAALAYFHKHSFPSEELRKKTAQRILSAAKKHGIHVSEDSDVARAARN